MSTILPLEGGACALHALRFVVAYVRAMMRPSPTFSINRFHGTSRCGAHVFSVVVLEDGTEPAVIGTNAWGGELVRFSCGNDVAVYTAAITMDDETDSASADFTVYFVLRDDDWRSGERIEPDIVRSIWPSVRSWIRAGHQRNHQRNRVDPSGLLRRMRQVRQERAAHRHC
jgi:hypothetical protein